MGMIAQTSLIRVHLYVVGVSMSYKLMVVLIHSRCVPIMWQAEEPR